MTGKPGRPHKTTVEYFPHPVSHGRVVFVLQEAYGNDGYAFWYKLQETLGEEPGHYINCQTPGSWEHLMGKVGIPNGKAMVIMGTLANIEAIDAELWDTCAVIWSEDFVDRLRPLYHRRENDLPGRPEHLLSFPITGDQKELFASFGIQSGRKPGISSIKEVTKGNKTKERERVPTRVLNEILNERFDTFWQAYPRKVSKGAARKAFQKLKPSEELVAQMVDAIEKWKATPQWQEKNGKFIPYPSTWLNGERWEDEIPEPEQAQKEWVPPERRGA